MRFGLVGRSIVCLTGGTPSEGLNLTEFEAALSLDRPLSQVATPPVLLADYTRVRLVAQGGQVQLELKPNAGKDLIRRAAREILRQVRMHGVQAVGFNVIFRIDTDEDDDLFSAVIRTDVIAQRLGVTTLRPGLKATYDSEHSVDTLSIDPDVSDEEAWIGQMNRHHSRDPDQTATDSAIAWLAAASDEVEALLRRLLRPTDD
ncbi:MAG: hypothetical protein ACLP8S_07080 [Solirubrobacteraceae bacterium]